MKIFDKISGTYKFAKSLIPEVDNDPLVNGYQINELTKTNKNFVNIWADKRGYKYLGGSVSKSKIAPLLNWAPVAYPAYQVKGKIGPHNFISYQYTNFERIGDFEFERNQWVVMAELSKGLPYLILDGKNESRISKRFTDFEEIKLEGNFHKKFSLYVPNNDHIDALSLITPDIMWILQENFQSVDMIIADKKVWLITSEMSNEVEGLENLIFAMTALLPELEQKAKSYKH